MDAAATATSASVTPAGRGETTVAPSTGAPTMAQLAGAAAERYADRVAVRRRRGDAWQSLSYVEVAAIVRELALGLIDLGVAPGERVALQCATRAEWTWCHFAVAAAGAVAVPVYPTSSAEEGAWILGDAQAVAVVCEDAAQVAKVRAVRAELPALHTIVVVEPDGATGDAVALDDLRARGRRGDPAALEARTAAVAPEDLFTIVYTSGTTGPPKGCLLSHANYRHVLDACEAVGTLRADDEIYLFLPLAHSFGILIELLAFDIGNPLAYCGGDPDRILPELQQIRPTYLPSVPRLFEKIYTRALASQPPEAQERMLAAARLGLAVRDLEARGAPVPPEMLGPFEQAEEALFRNVRALFGGRLRHATSGAAPIAREILEFFHGCGVPVLEGYGMTETATVASTSTLEHHRFGSVGRLLPGVEGRIAADGELLLRGPNIFAGYHGDPAATSAALADGWLHTGDLATIDEDGYLFITGRKKDIIITAGGKNLSPANLENDMKQSRWVSQAVLHGDRRPYPVMLVTLDEEQVVPWARERGIADTSIPALARHPDVVALVEGELARANARYARPAQAKRLLILDHDLSPERGELTPTLKVKRAVVEARHRDALDALYRS